ncbi:MAG TPA: PEGA domain-containing protein [Polyangiaceae bacterium]|nr:PEGA domain-containing protein [Polyangiaceae bacterium]
MLLVAFALVLAPARAANAETERQASARLHFEKGYRLVEQGALDAAIEEFEHAYAQSPHFSVLYNLGQAYASLGRSVEAVDRLERYLELGGAGLNEARVAQVRELIRYHAGRIGSLSLELDPADAQVAIDGRVLDPAARSAPIRLNIGVHGVVAQHPDYAQASTSARIEAGRTLRVSLVLASEPVPPISVSVSCRVPDVELTVDGVRVGTLPAPSLVLAPGLHRLGFHRPGYVMSEQTIQAVAGGSYACAPAFDPRTTSLATLRVRHPSGTLVLLDGAPHGTRPVPEGRHHASVSGPGYETTERIVTLAAHRTHTVELMPPRSSTLLLAEQRERERTRRVAGFIVGGVGGAALLGAGSLYLYNGAAYDDWQAQSANVLARFRANPDAVSAREVDALFDERNQIHNRDAIAVGVGVFGLVSLAAASALLLWPSASDEPATITGSSSSVRVRF